jgi:hypothetical protein
LLNLSLTAVLEEIHASIVPRSSVV